MYYKLVTHPVSASLLLDESEFAYAFDCTFFRLICLTAKTLRRITMRGFLVGTTELDKSAGQPICTAIGRLTRGRYKDVPHVKRTFKRVQLQFLG